MDREFPTGRAGLENRNGAAPARPGNGLGAAVGKPNGGVNGAGHGNGLDGPALAGASAVVRPVPGGEHKGALTLIKFTQPANGTVSRNADQTLTYRPDPGFTGKDSFGYALRDEAGTLFSATVTLAVTLDAPAIKPAAARASALRMPSLRPAGTGAGSPRLNGGTARFPGE